MVKIILNKFILIALIASSNFLLPGKKTLSTSPAAATKNNSLTSIQDLGPIKITPLYAPDLNNLKQALTTPESIKQINSAQETSPQPPKNKPLILPAEWILKASMENAPELLKGIFLYLQSRSRCIDESQHSMTISSFHRFILVGPPGSGKTTLAHAIAHMLGYRIVFIPATGLLGRFRNEAANNIQNFLREHSSDGLKKVIIIDELHKLFEHHDDNHTDHSQTAAAFWLALDDLEKRSPNIIFIGTANNVDKLPPEIKSRFSGKIITMPTPNKNQKIQAFKDSITHDNSAIIGKSVNNAFITRMIQQIENCSLRDVQLIIDTAKIFYYAENTNHQNMFPIILTKTHFQQALNQLQAESQVLQENFSDNLCKKLQPWGVVFAIAANVCVLVRTPSDLYKAIPESVKKKIFAIINNVLNNNINAGTI